MQFQYFLNGLPGQLKTEFEPLNTGVSHQRIFGRGERLFKATERPAKAQ